jgi:hypothetical protein
LLLDGDGIVANRQDENEYNPESVVVCVLVTPVASFLAVTVAPGTAAPFESLMVPVIFEVPVWANVERQNPRALKREKNLEGLSMDVLLWAE